MVGALVGAGISIIGGLIKNSRAKKREAKIQKELDAYQRQDFNNVAKQLTVDTTAADIANRQSDVALATAIENARKGGARQLISTVPLATTAHEKTADKIRAGLTSERQKINQLIAQDEQNIRRLREDREIADLKGMGTALDVYRHNREQGFADILSGVGNVATTLGGSGIFDGLFAGGSTTTPTTDVSATDNNGYVGFWN